MTLLKIYKNARTIMQIFMQMSVVFYQNYSKVHLMFLLKKMQDDLWLNLYSDINLQKRTQHKGDF